MNTPTLINNAKNKITKINAINISNCMNYIFKTKVEVTLNPDNAPKENPYVYVTISTENYDDIELHVKGCEVDVAIDAVLETFFVMGNV